jgi:hypothetical protein
MPFLTLNRLCTMCNCGAVRQAAINYLSGWTLMSEDMLLHRASAFVYDSYTDDNDVKKPADGLRSAFEDCIANFKYETFAESMDAKQMPSPLPLDKDGRLVWQNFLDFFAAYVEVFYPEDGAKVEDDPELNAYWASLERASTMNKDSGQYNGYGLPALSKKTLIEQLTHTAFWVTGIHEVSGSVVEMFESPRAMQYLLLPITLSDPLISNACSLVAMTMCGTGMHRQLGDQDLPAGTGW